MTALHFVIVLAFSPLVALVKSRLRGSIRLHVTYEDGRGVLRQLLQACDERGWQLTSLASDGPATAGGLGAVLTLSGSGVLRASAVLAAIDGVTAIDQLEDETE